VAPPSLLTGVRPRPGASRRAGGAARRWAGIGARALPVTAMLGTPAPLRLRHQRSPSGRANPTTCDDSSLTSSLQHASRER
jgi:hypothetical protein